MAERMSTVLPTVRCGNCGIDVRYSELSTHECEKAPALPIIIGRNVGRADGGDDGDGDDNRGPNPRGEYSPLSPDNPNQRQAPAVPPARETGPPKPGGASSSGSNASRSFMEKYTMIVSGDRTSADGEKGLGYNRPTAAGDPDHGRSPSAAADRPREHPEPGTPVGGSRDDEPTDDDKTERLLSAGISKGPARLDSFFGGEEVQDADFGRPARTPFEPDGDRPYGGRDRWNSEPALRTALPLPPQQLRRLSEVDERRGDGGESRSEGPRSAEPISFPRTHPGGLWYGSRDKVDEGRYARLSEDGRGGDRETRQPMSAGPNFGGGAGQDAQGYIQRKYGITPPTSLTREEFKPPTPPPVLERLKDPKLFEPHTSSFFGPPSGFGSLSETSPSAATYPLVDPTGASGDRRIAEADYAVGRQEGGTSPIKYQAAKLLTPSRNDTFPFPSTKGPCDNCNLSIREGEAAYEAAGKILHTACFRCDQCGIPLDNRSGFLNLNGSVICAKYCSLAVAVNAGSTLNPPPPPRKDSRGQSESRSPPVRRESREKSHVESRGKVDIAARSRGQADGRSAESGAARDVRGTRDQQPGPICNECRFPISGRPVFAFRKPYHEEHLCCRHCQKPIITLGGHVEHEGSVYCVADFAELFLARCNACKKPIDGEAVCALDGKWHPGCFGCQICKKPFADSWFYVLDNMPLCQRHYHERNNSLCRGCGEPIEGACAQIKQDEAYGGGLLRYHPSHFACTICRVPLNEVYYQYMGKPYCEQHVMEIQKKKSIKIERRRTQYATIPGGNRA